MYGCLSYAPYWGPSLQPRHVLGLGIEPATLWFTGQHSATEPHQPGPNFVDNSHEVLNTYIKMKELRLKTHSPREADLLVSTTFPFTGPTPNVQHPQGPPCLVAGSVAASHVAFRSHLCSR